MKTNILIIAALIVFVLIFSIAGKAADNPDLLKKDISGPQPIATAATEDPQVETLKGIPEIQVSIEKLSKDAISAGLDKDDILAHSESRLGKARIKVVDSSKKPQHALLSIHINLTCNPSVDICVCGIFIDLKQLVVLNKSADLSPQTYNYSDAIPAATWNKNFVGLGGGDSSKENVLNELDVLLDMFAKDYLKANQK